MENGRKNSERQLASLASSSLTFFWIDNLQAGLFSVR